MHVYRADLPHAVQPRNGLVLDCGLPLGLGENDHGGGLHVETDPARLDLAREH
jgi:hypothetical protein